MQGLEAGERVLARGAGSDGAVTATDRRLMWPAGSIRWFEIERASWNGDELYFDVMPVATSEHPEPYRVHVTEPGRLVDVVREQVVSSVVISRHVPLTGQRGVRITGRRTANGDLVWNAVLDPGVDLEDSDMRTRLDAAVNAVRSEIE
jgi:hypothetical protein